jgi:hypothetical protein
LAHLGRPITLLWRQIEKPSNRRKRGQKGHQGRSFDIYIWGDKGRRTDLTGGALIRSSGGWINVAVMRRDKSTQKSDERILGHNAFVEEVLKSAQEQMEQTHRLKAEGCDLEKLVQHICTAMNIDKSELFAGRKERLREALC